MRAEAPGISNIQLRSAVGFLEKRITSRCPIKRMGPYFLNLILNFIMFLLNSVIYTSDVCCGNHPLGSTQIPQPNLAAPQP